MQKNNIIKKINLIDRNPDLCAEWYLQFKKEIDEGLVNVVCAKQDEYFETKAAALISPANSFGIMDGGLDKIIIDKYGFFIQELIQEKISRNCFGENPIGNAVIIGGYDIELSPCPFRWIISAPTMRQPEYIGDTYNSYLAMRAILVQMKHFHISSVNICGLGTGIGHMPENRCAEQMKMAYNQVINWNGQQKPYKELWAEHCKLKNEI